MTEQDLINKIYTEQKKLKNKEITSEQYKKFHEEMKNTLYEYQCEDAKVFSAQYQLFFGLRAVLTEET